MLCAYVVLLIIVIRNREDEVHKTKMHPSRRRRRRGEETNEYKMKLVFFSQSISLSHFLLRRCLPDLMMDVGGRRSITATGAPTEPLCGVQFLLFSTHQTKFVKEHFFPLY